MIAALAREHFGLEGEPRPLPGELDRNYAVAGHVLKLHAPGTDPGWLDLQDAAMEHVAGRAGVATPRVVRGLDGSARVTTPEGVARLLTWVPGTPWAGVAAHGADALGSLGRAVAALDAALASFDHPALERPLRWNMLRAGELRGDATGVAGAVLDRFAERIEPALRELPAQAIHNDANEHNVLVGGDGRVSGLIDFGDLCRAPRACGLAVACAYAMTALAVPEREVLPLVAGYHEVAPLAPEELSLLPELIRTRLAMSVAMAARQRREQPGNDYLLISQDGVTALLGRIGAVPPELEHLRLRDACGYEAVPTARAVRGFLATAEIGPVCGPPLDRAPVIDFSGDDPPPPAVAPAIGRYLEDRRVYDSGAFEAELPGERRTLHLGVDVFLPAGEPILAPLDGVVRDVACRPARRDWGGIVVLDHETPEGIEFPHALRSPRPRVGRAARAAAIASRAASWSAGSATRTRTAGGRRTCTCSCSPPTSGAARTPTASGRWPSATSGSRSTRTRTSCSACPGASGRSRRATPPAYGPPAGSRVSRALSLAYAEPLHIVRGEGAYLYDEHRPGLSRPRQQRLPRRPRPPARRRGGGGADGAAQHQHPLPARPAGHLRAPPHRDAARSH